MDWGVYGHEWAARMLQSHIVHQEMRHAYLLTGPAGIGRRTLALRFAQALNCLNPPAPGAFCGTCRICRQTAEMQHSDLAVLQAEKEGGVLKVEQVRELQHSLSLLPYEAHYRVALLLRFHEAHPSAQNALLKTLEEAPQRVVLLLTADSAESLLPTITSRCEILRLRPMGLDALTERLTGKDFPRANARMFAHLSGGRVGYADRLMHNQDMLELRRAYVEDLLHMLGSNRRERLAYADGVYRDRESLRERFSTWLSFWRDLMLRAAAPDLPLVNLDFEEDISTLAQQLSVLAARTCVSDLERGIARLDANLNARLLTEVLLLDWPHLILKGESDD